MKSNQYTEKNTMKKNQTKNTKKQIQAEARREEVKKWQEMANTLKYKLAAVKQARLDATSEIINECFDGILLNLKERSSSKSHNVQKRILRRIIEKRQAQSIHRLVGRSNDRSSNFMENYSFSKSALDIHNYRFCVS